MQSVARSRPGLTEPQEAASEVGEALRVLDLSKTFRSGFLRRTIPGIEGVSFSVERGSVFALLGHNGAGKTTTINCLLDLVRPDRGEVSILGKDSLDPEARRNIGYLPERPYFFEHLTGAELLDFYGRLLGLERVLREERIDQLIERMGLTKARNRRLKKYSKGMLQRIGLAQALLGDPDLLILDEPMSGLDPMGRREVRELLLEIKEQGKTIILSSHIVPDIEMVADSVGILRDGRLVETRNLDRQQGDLNYRVELSCTPEQAAVVLPSWVAAESTSKGPGPMAVVAHGPAPLEDLLRACREARIPVLSVDTQRSGLEEIFLEVNAGVEVAS